MLARLKLYQKMNEIGFDKVYYCDSDSIAADMEINDSLFSKELGEWSLEFII